MRLCIFLEGLERGLGRCDRRSRDIRHRNRYLYRCRSKLPGRVWGGGQPPPSLSHRFRAQRRDATVEQLTSGLGVGGGSIFGWRHESELGGSPQFVTCRNTRNGHEVASTKRLRPLSPDANKAGRAAHCIGRLKTNDERV